MFVTAAAQNLLCLKLAAELGAPIPDPWVTWFKGACVPALLGLITIPYMIYKMDPPGEDRKLGIDVLHYTRQHIDVCSSHCSVTASHAVQDIRPTAR